VEPLTERDPERLGDWELLARVAEGGMGVVYLARREGEIAALKAVQEQLAWDEEYRLRFRHEVDALSCVRSPFVVPLLDADTDGDTPWLVMAYVPATSLEVTIRRSGPLSRLHGLRFLSKLSQGVGALHAAGVTHRDLKPSNVLVTDDGPCIIDLGIARVDEGSGTGTYGPLTEAWSSPEQLEAHPEVSPASDVFNLGLIAGFALCGKHPFGRATSVREIAAMVVAMCSGRPTALEVDPDVEQLLVQCFADPDQRPSPGSLTQSFANLARGVDLDSAAEEVRLRLNQWHTQRNPSLASRPGDDEPGTTSGGAEVSAPAKERHRFVVVPASLGWNQMLGMNDELQGALQAASLQPDRRQTELTWSWRDQEFVLPFGQDVELPDGDESLWHWLDRQVEPFSLQDAAADLGGRLLYLPQGRRLYISLNPDVVPGRPHHVVLETEPQRRPTELEELGARYPNHGAVWDEADEERLVQQFLDGVPLDRLVEDFGRSASALCARLEMLEVLEPVAA
jgi:serine/threonine protein kinase